MFEKRKRRAAFLAEKSNIKRTLEREILDGDVAYIPCKVEGIDDIISKYSVVGCESLDLEFAEFVTGFIDSIPSEYPVVLELTGPEFSPEEKETINYAIKSEMEYMLGIAEEDSKRRKRRFIGMMVGTIITGCMLGFVRQFFDAFPQEFFYVLFWLFADALVRYIFIEKLDFKEERVRAGRLASMKVEFKVDQQEPGVGLV